MVVDQGRYSIGSIAQITGLTTHTLRAWERRYGFPKPTRSEGGTRRYTEEDMERLKVIVALLDAGHRPGDVVGRPHGELVARLAKQTPVTTVGETPQVGDLLKAIAADDHEGFRWQLRRSVVERGPKGFLVDVVAPLMFEIGEAWARGELGIQQEHFASELIGGELRVLASAYSATSTRPRVLLTTLPGEMHRLGLDMVVLYMAIHGAAPLLLGPSTPIPSIVEAAASQRVDVVGLSVSLRADPEQVSILTKQLLEELPRRVEVWLGGRGSDNDQLDLRGVVRVASWDALHQAIDNWRKAS